MYVEICRIFGKKPTPKEGVGRSNRLGDAKNEDGRFLNEIGHLFFKLLSLDVVS